MENVYWETIKLFEFELRTNKLTTTTFNDKQIVYICHGSKYKNEPYGSIYFVVIPLLLECLLPAGIIYKANTALTQLILLQFRPQHHTVYPKKYAHGFVVLCFVVVLQSFIMNSHEVFIHIHQGCFAGTGAIVRLPQCQWSKPDGYGKISQCITTTKHSKAKTVCIFLWIYCILILSSNKRNTLRLRFIPRVMYTVLLCFGACRFY